MAYIASENIVVFPNAQRASANDSYLKARKMTEENLTGILRHVTDQPSYVISKSYSKSGEFEFVIDGYYFRVLHGEDIVNAVENYNIQVAGKREYDIESSTSTVSFGTTGAKNIVNRVTHLVDQSETEVSFTYDETNSLVTLSSEVETGKIIVYGEQYFIEDGTSNSIQTGFSAIDTFLVNGETPSDWSSSSDSGGLLSLELDEGTFPAPENSGDYFAKINLVTSGNYTELQGQDVSGQYIGVQFLKYYFGENCLKVLETNNGVINIPLSSRIKFLPDTIDITKISYIGGITVN